MRIVCISDTHLNAFKAPDGDILVHAGDFCCEGTLRELASALAWFGALPHRCKVVIGGNHDVILQQGREVAESMMRDAGVIYLRDSWAEIDGLSFWGSPWTPWFNNWAFNLPRGPELAAKWRQIPEGLDVLITHGPPAGILDRAYGWSNAGPGESVGAPTCGSGWMPSGRGSTSSATSITAKESQRGTAPCP